MSPGCDHISRVGPAPDLRRSLETLEEYLAQDSVLTESQKRNARLKAEDLHEQRVRWQSVPFRLLFEFNRRCNVKCVHCDIPRKGTGDLSIDVLERVLDEIGWGLWEIMPFAGGEPTLAPIHEAAPLLRRHNVHFNFITNGIRFEQEFFEPIADMTARLQFSLHSHHRDIFERIMPRSNFDSVVENIRDAVRLGERTGTHVVACIVAMDEVIDDLEDYVDFAADLGLRRVIIQKLYPHTQQLESLDPLVLRPAAQLQERWERVVERAVERGVYIETNVPGLFRRPEVAPPARTRFDLFQENVGIVELFAPGFCMATATQAVIEWDGSLLPCIKDHIVLGNIHASSLLDVWNGQAMRSLRETFHQQTLRKNCATCKAFYLGHP